MVQRRLARPVGPGRAAWNWRAGVFAGFAAGVVATVAQIALWAISTGALPHLLIRDSRFAAAIVLGPGILQRPQGIEWDVMLAATAVHIALSLFYGLIVSRLVTALDAMPALLAGVTFGIALYVLNMFGFTAVFPWFAADRDWITAVVHGIFGLTIAGIYVALRARSASTA